MKANIEAILTLVKNKNSRPLRANLVAIQSLGKIERPYPGRLPAHHKNERGLEHVRGVQAAAAKAAAVLATGPKSIRDLKRLVNHPAQ